MSEGRFGCWGPSCPNSTPNSTGDRWLAVEFSQGLSGPRTMRAIFCSRRCLVAWARPEPTEPGPEAACAKPVVANYTVRVVAGFDFVVCADAREKAMAWARDVTQTVFARHFQAAERLWVDTNTLETP